LKDLNIKYIVNVSAEISNYYPDHFTYYQIPIRDNNAESIRPHFQESFEKIDSFLEKNDGNVFVHCFMGASRSATIVANYISRKTNDDITTILVNLKKQRPVVNLTNQFVSDLRAENV
jgi:protein-tyrosine phosphatase